MISEIIDLYEYFGVERKGATEGMLTVYAHNQFGDLPPRKHPAMLVIPGGGYHMTSEREGEPIAIAYYAKNFCSFVLHYTTRTPHPVPLFEACMAMAFIRENAEKYSVDTERVSAVGFSAGGHLTGTLATLYGDATVCSMLKEKAHLFRPDAVVMSYAVVTTDRSFTHEGTASTISGGNEELREYLSVEKRVTENTPPAFIWHTAEDDAVPVLNSLALAQAYAKAGVPFDLHVFEYGRHGLATCDLQTNPADYCDYIKRDEQWIERSVEWLNERGFVLSEK